MSVNPKPTILVIGSVAWDEALWLDGPLQVGSHNSARGALLRIGGGAANTAMALARAGDHAVVVSGVGQDESGQRLLDTLAGLGVDIAEITRSAQTTTRSLVLLDGTGERTVVNLRRAEVPLLPHLAGLPAECCYVRSADPSLAPILARRVTRGMVVAHVPPFEEGLRPAQVLVGSASDLDNDFMGDPWAAGRRTAGEVLRWVVITDGPRGAVAYGDGVVLEQLAPQVEVVDSTGAGDVFAAGLAHALAEGDDMRAALKTAVGWGSASVRYEGTVPPVGFPGAA